MSSKHLKLTLVALLLTMLTACGPGWSTSYSQKVDAENMIFVILTNHGEPVRGFCGPARAILESYSFDLKPIQHVYTDDEVEISQSRDQEGSVKGYPRLQAKGTVSFNESYSKVTINLTVLKDGRFVPFSGNGTHRMNRDAHDF